MFECESANKILFSLAPFLRFLSFKGPSSEKLTTFNSLEWILPTKHSPHWSDSHGWHDNQT